jgi:two-component system phosphate regulon sensor histidine kinase PhoR
LGRISFSKPLLFKLTSLALVVTLLSVGVTTFFVVQVAQTTLYERAEDSLLAEARSMRLYLEEADLTGPRLNERVKQLGQQGGRYLTVFDADGGILARSYSEDIAPEDLITAAVRLNEGHILQIGVPRAEVRSKVTQLIHGAIMVGVLVAGLAVLVAYLVNRVIAGPIMDLLVVVRRLKHREFGRRVLVRSDDEIGQLGRAFNDLSETLEELFDAISDRERKLDAILSSMSDGVLAVNMQRRVILANRAVSDMFNVDEQSIIGKSQFEATRNTHLSKLLDDTIDSGRPIVTEIRLRPGSERTIAVTSSPLTNQDGTALGAVAVLRDVTDLRHLEQMRQEFVANVSHELRTPLTSIKGFVETLLAGNLDDRALTERFLKIISGETDRMIALINDLLDLSRIESGKQPLNLEPVDLKELFDDTIMILQSKADAKKMTVQNFIYDPVTVEGDAKLLKQVAINLLDNAIKYTPEGGTVTVEAVKSPDEVEIIVSDNGVGIPAQHLDRVFERFYRVDKGRSRNMGGTGLGLAIVKHIVDKHKGSICAESRVGKGTKMRLTLPRMNYRESGEKGGT